MVKEALGEGLSVADRLARESSVVVAVAVAVAVVSQ